MNRQSFVKKYSPWALVTGASDGIGEAFAEELAALGINVVLVARRGDRLQQLAVGITRRHRIEARVIAADLSAVGGRALLEQHRVPNLFDPFRQAVA